MKSSYTFTCQSCYIMRSYAPGVGETVYCTHRRQLKDETYSEPCGRKMTKVEGGN